MTGAQMLSRKYNCIFIHIPKVAGQSIERVFLQLHGLTWETREPLLLRLNPDPGLGPPALAHLKASEYVTCGYLSEEEFRSFYRFSFVRNPWGRLVSIYSYLGFDEVMPFKQFLRADFSDAERWEPALFLQPQYDYLFNERGEQLVDYIGRFESLQKDFDHVCDAIGIEHTTLPHANKTERGGSSYRRIKKLVKNLSPFHMTYDRHVHYTQYYDDDDRIFVASKYEKDVDVFGYRFGD